MFARTSGGDFALPMSVVQDPATITAQKITDELNLWLGSWSFDVTQGMPWLQEILGIKNPSMTKIRALFRSALMATPRVVSVLALAFAIDPKTRHFTYSFTVKVDTGAIVKGGAGVAFSPS